MATTMTITTTDEQDAAIQQIAQDALAGRPHDTPQPSVSDYLTEQITTMLDGYVRQYRIAHAPITPEQGIDAFLNATPEQQAAALAALGVQVPEAQP